MSELNITVNVDEKLSLNKFEVDEENAHIKIKEGVKASDPEFHKLVMCCPAALYKMPAEGDDPIFAYHGRSVPLRLGFLRY